MKLVEYLRNNSIDIAMFQEHKIKSMTKLDYLLKFFHIILNKSLLLKGGTIILIDKRLSSNIVRSYLHPSSRIITCVLDIMGTPLYLVNVYAHSGKNKEQEREELFETELMYILIPNTDNLVLAGDWNSILLARDTSKTRNACFSKSLKGIINSFKYKDIFSSNLRKPEFTYYRNNYGARLDRIYLSRLFNNIEDVITLPVSFSDHLCVCVKLALNPQMQVARPRWRMNVSLLGIDIIKQNLNRNWNIFQLKKNSYTNIIQWWEEFVKPQIKYFYINVGKEQNKLKKGLMEYYERKLRKLYDNANNCNIIDYDMIK